MTDSFNTGQSPIDIRTEDLVHRPDLPELVFVYPNEPATVDVCLEIKDGDPVGAVAEVVPEVVVRVSGVGAYLELDGVRFDLESLHWHTPSEHWIDGRPAPLEVHLVHRNAAGAYAVVGVLSLVGDPDEAIAPAFDLIDGFDPGSLGPGAAQCAPASMSLRRLLPEAQTTFRYHGSLTTAPFSDGVSWIVLTEPLRASVDQIDRHMSLVSARYPAVQDPPASRPNPPGNARRIQPSGGRRVITDLAERLSGRPGPA